MPGSPCPHLQRPGAAGDTVFLLGFLLARCRGGPGAPPVATGLPNPSRGPGASGWERSRNGLRKPDFGKNRAGSKPVPRVQAEPDPQQTRVTSRQILGLFLIPLFYYYYFFNPFRSGNSPRRDSSIVIPGSAACPRSARPGHKKTFAKVFIIIIINFSRSDGSLRGFRIPPLAPPSPNRLAFGQLGGSLRGCANGARFFGVLRRLSENPGTVRAKKLGAG